jgi:hypothetical protein
VCHRASHCDNALQFLGGMRMFLDHCWCVIMCQCITSLCALVSRWCLIVLRRFLLQGAACIERWQRVVTKSRDRLAADVWADEANAAAVKNAIRMTINRVIPPCLLCPALPIRAGAFVCVAFDFDGHVADTAAPRAAELSSSCVQAKSRLCHAARTPPETSRRARRPAAHDMIYTWAHAGGGLCGGL